MSQDVQMPLAIDEIIIGDTRREINAAAVKRLADSINAIGLRHPVTVRRKGDTYLLVAGRHRIEACRKLGREHVLCNIVSMTNDDARLWEIAENLHRVDLTKLERDEQVAEWIKITERISISQSGSLRADGRGGRPGGIETAARELGVQRQDAHRAVQVASLSEEAKDAAREAGLDNNRSALLMASREETPEAQAAKITELALAKVNRIPSAIDRTNADKNHFTNLRMAWAHATDNARIIFLESIGAKLVGRHST